MATEGKEERKPADVGEEERTPAHVGKKERTTADPYRGDRRPANAGKEVQTTADTDEENRTRTAASEHDVDDDPRSTHRAHLSMDPPSYIYSSVGFNMPLVYSECSGEQSPQSRSTYSPPKRDAGYFVLQQVNVMFTFCFIRLPFYVMRKIPRSDGLLSVAFMFFFLQMLGYIWLLIVAFIGAHSVKLTRCIDEWPSFCFTPTDGSYFDMSSKMFSQIVGLYVNYCLMRGLFFIAKAVYDFGWESFYEFPTIRKLLVDSLMERYSLSGAVVSEVTHSDVGSPRRSLTNRPLSEATQSMQSPDPSSPRMLPPATRRHLHAQRITLVLPLLFLILSGVVLLIICLVNSPHEALRPTGRAQRLSRYVLLVCFFQWMSQYTLMFPQWHKAVWVANKKIVYVIYASSAIGFSRLVLWVFVPSASEKIYWWTSTWAIFDMPAYTTDAVVLNLAMISVLYGVVYIVGNKKALRMSGYKPRMFEDEVRWRDHIILFKYGVTVGSIFHFTRGILSSSIGIVNAQNDHIVYSMIYPAILTSIWCVTFTLSWLRLASVKLLAIWICVAMAGAHVLCAVSNVSGHVLVNIFVTIHLVRQILKRKIFHDSRKNRDLSMASPTGSLSVVNDVFFFSLLGLAFAFCGTLMALSVISRYQEKYEYFFPSIGFNITSSGDVYVDHLISELDLVAGGEQRVQFPRYAICDTEEHLSPLDFALLSLVPYYDPHDIPRVMEGLFPPKANLPWEIRNTNAGKDSKVIWNELFFPTLNLTVLAVRGTDATKLADYVEDMRMWTEPTSISLLSLFIPSVRVWTKSATEMVIHGVHETMHMIGVYHEEWNYKPLLDYVKSFPAEQKVLLTGHSMGGGTASIIGTLARRRVFAVQPPGIYHSIAKHQKMYERDAHYRWLHHEQTTVVVEGDWINNAFDEHGGMVQKIGCEHPEMALMGGCHMLEGTICHFLKHCGDPRHRWSSCEVRFTQPLKFGLDLALNFATQNNWAEAAYNTLHASGSYIATRTEVVGVFAGILGLFSIWYFGL
eukprot:GEMP01002647.1.p1 GENE.GEMP01002647.1~~GEMP01002647.1.p1  ORF type:complete len:1022 (+),score=168.47 GEMP01002647.1:228-3293(+)